MNKLEKKSFFSFLSLYLGSSFIFVLLSGFWYYSAQKNFLENTTYYKMQHLADTISSLVIRAHMMKQKLSLPQNEDGFEYILIPSKEHKVYKKNYFEKDGFKILISSATQEHLGIKYVVIKTNNYHKNIRKLKIKVLTTMIVIFIAIVIISWMLSKLFMRPIHDKMIQIEQFIQDVSHELNTPITALTMSSKRALQKKVYDEKILTNISISTKQLYSIYQSLAFLNFSTQEQELKNLDLKPLLEQSIKYYLELSIAKNITIKAELDDATLTAVESRIELLFSNLISNAIKYSMPNTIIHIKLKAGFFSIKDEGVGIAEDKLQKIFSLYERSSTLAGGFGVGLSIVKKICDEYNIKIKLQSELQKGSYFSFRW